MHTAVKLKKKLFNLHNTNKMKNNLLTADLSISEINCLRFFFFKSFTFIKIGQDKTKKEFPQRD